jgi:glycosyltransferase involved in cell wall biosynthesis
MPSPDHGIATVTAVPSRRLPALWISWNVHRRTTGLCAAWDVPLRIVRSAHTNRLRRWVGLGAETFTILRRYRPEILFVQNPSLALSIFAITTRRLFGLYLVIDAHNEGVRPYDRQGAFVHWVTRRLLKGADLTIVTNAALVSDVRAAGGRPLVLPDSLPVPSVLPSKLDIPVPDVAVIATFRPDEPIEAIMEAAATMPEVRFAFSGDPARFRATRTRLPCNVQLTEFLPDPAYWKLLAQARVVCDLTLKPDCLVCGAYEALALAKPMVLSDNPATRRIFGPAAILTGSTPGEIAEALRKALDQEEQLEMNARELRQSFPARWQPQSAETWNAIRKAAADLTRVYS